MLAFIDAHPNRKLDFGNNGEPGEAYAAFGTAALAGKRDITFSSASACFSRANALVAVAWRR